MNDQEFKMQVFPLKDKIFRFAWRILQQREEAEDVTQEVLLRLWGRKHKLEQYTSIEALAMQSAKNLCLDRLRHQKIRIKKLHQLKLDQPGNNHETDLENKEMHSIISRVIRKLPVRQKMVIHLKDVEGYSTREITEILGMEVVAVRTNLSRARKKVREKMQKILNHGI